MTQGATDSNGAQPIKVAENAQRNNRMWKVLGEMLIVHFFGEEEK